MCQASPSSELHKILQPEGRGAPVSTGASAHRRIVHGGTDFDDQRGRCAECRAGAECCTSWRSRGADALLPPADGHRGFLCGAFCIYCEGRDQPPFGSRSASSLPLYLPCPRASLTITTTSANVPIGLRRAPLRGMAREMPCSHSRRCAACRGAATHNTHQPLSERAPLLD